MFHRWVRTTIETIKVARPGFWPTHYWFFLLPFAGRDMFGQLMDIEEDATAGRHGTAITIGVANSKLLLVVIMIVEAVIAYLHFRFSIVSLFMALGAVFFLIDALVGPRRYPVRFSKAFFVLWNLVVIATMHFVWRYEVFF